MQAARVVGRELKEALWVVPLAAVVSITVLTSRRARDRWPEPRRRVLLGLIVTVGFYGLTAAVGLSRALLVLGLPALIAGLLAAWVLVLPRRVAPLLPAETLDTLGGS